MEFLDTITAVRDIFPNAICIGHSALLGYCIADEMGNVLVTGQHPRAAWKNAHKLIKDKKSLQKLLKAIAGQVPNPSV